MESLKTILTRISHKLSANLNNLSQHFVHLHPRFCEKCGLTIALSSSLLASSIFCETSQILFLMHNGNSELAIDRYFEEYKQSGEHDFELLQELAFVLIEQGWHSKDLESKLLALFGAGISGHEKAIDILQEAMSSKEPQLQLIALNLLAKQQNDKADEAIKQALGSPFALIRLEALYHLAQNKDSNAAEQAEALMSKLPSEIKAIFPKIFARLDDPRSTKIMRRLLNDPSERVRLETILNIGEMKRDDLMPKIRQIALQKNCAQQEACAAVMGVLGDSASIPALKKLLNTPSSQVKIAVCKSLVQLGDQEAIDPVIEAAINEDLFAISTLSELENTENVLAKLVLHENLQIRINAALGLLEKRDARCLPTLFEVLIEDSRGLAFTKTFSQGSTLSYWKAIPSAKEKVKGDETSLELSTRMREETLTKMLELPENIFLKAIDIVIQSKQTSLIPVIITLLETLQTPRAISMLKKYQQQVGAPLLRNYCILALYRLKEDPVYETLLQTTVTNQKDFELIRFRPVVPSKSEKNRFQMNPEERSRFLIEALESLTSAQNQEGVETLLKTIRYGNEKNRYALAGLLTRAIQ